MSTDERLTSKMLRSVVLNWSLAVCVLFLLGATMAWQVYQVHVASGQMSRSLALHSAAERTDALLEGMASDERAYLATGEFRHRAAYGVAHEALVASLKALEASSDGTAPLPSRPARTDAVVRSVGAWDSAAQAELARIPPRSMTLSEPCEALYRAARASVRAYQAAEAQAARESGLTIDRESRFAAGLGLLRLVLGLACIAFLGVRQFRTLTRGFDRNIAELREQKVDLEQQSADLISRQAQVDALLNELAAQNEALERRVLERTRQLSEKARLLDLAPCVIAVVSLDTACITYWNPGAEAIYGFSAEEAVGQDPVALLRMRAAESPAQIRVQLLREGYWEGNVTETRRDGAVITVHKSIVLQRDEAGEAYEVLMVGADITNEQKTQVALAEARDVAEKANIAKSSFLANMSHELRTPLNAILGYSEMLVEEAKDTGTTETTADLQKISSAGRHLLTLINDILDLSKIEAGMMETYLELLDPADVIEEVVNTIQPLVSKRANTLAVSIKTPLPPLTTDGTKLRQCLLNLLSNACKFTERGHIELTATVVSVDGRDWLEISVSDTGIGMTEGQMAGLFREFHQADASTTRRFGGTGLGLAISQRFSRMLGGTIRLESEFGVGSTFTLSLPAELPAVDAARG